ncbi:MAG: methyltransferase domain-containing protein [Pseudomonadota bacterium]
MSDEEAGKPTAGVAAAAGGMPSGDDKALVQAQFGAHAANYVTSVVHAKGASLQRLVEVVAPQADWQVLDVATATGHTAFAFAPHVAEVVASDITGPMLEQAQALARERGITNVTTARADAESLGFEDARFDLVTCRIAPHHFTNIAAFLSSAHRVLKPHGTLAIVDNIAPDALSTPGFDATALRDAAVTYNAFETLRDPSHARALALAEWRELLGDTGFTLRHEERLAKDMAFTPWAERLGASPAVIDRLREMLGQASPALEAFLRPREHEGDIWFTLDEALLVASRGA